MADDNQQPSLQDQLAAVTNPDFAAAVAKVAGPDGLQAALNVQNGTDLTTITKYVNDGGNLKPIKVTEPSKQAFKDSVDAGIVKGYLGQTKIDKDFKDALSTIGGDDAVTQMQTNEADYFASRSGDSAANDRLNGSLNALNTDIGNGLDNALANPQTQDPDKSGPILPQTNAPANAPAPAPDANTPAPAPDANGPVHTPAPTPATNAAPQNAPNPKDDTTDKVPDPGTMGSNTPETWGQWASKEMEAIKNYFTGPSAPPKTPEQIAQDKLKDAQDDLTKNGAADLASVLSGNNDPDKLSKLIEDLVTVATNGKGLGDVVNGGTQVATGANVAPANGPNAAPQTGTGQTRT